MQMNLLLVISRVNAQGSKHLTSSKQVCSPAVILSKFHHDWSLIWKIAHHACEIETYSLWLHLSQAIIYYQSNIWMHLRILLEKR